MSQIKGEYETPWTPPDVPSLLHYTSGSTGKPKGVLHRHGSLYYQQQTGRDILQLAPGVTYWCTADPGWVTGTSYGVIVPWSLGVRQIHFSGGFDAQKWFEILEGEKVNIWYTAPTALRMLMREDEACFNKFDLSSLRHIFSVGEPLNPEVIHWGRRIFGKPIHDTWFQTETGAIMISNSPDFPVCPGSMGKPVAGIGAEILDDSGAVLPAEQEGHLCLKPGWGSMFTQYLNNEAAYKEKFAHGWYHTGDVARRDNHGYFWFLGRSDDVINTAGHLVSPFEVESALLEVPEIAESAVIGVPDQIFYEKVVAFVALKEAVSWSKALEIKVRLHLSNKVSTTATPQDLVVVDKIPKNSSGKILRRLLKARYLGKDAGDLSTHEP
jgi:acetyl-CoA synthetase